MQPRLFSMLAKPCKNRKYFFGFITIFILIIFFILIEVHLELIKLIKFDRQLYGHFRNKFLGRYEHTPLHQYDTPHYKQRNHKSMTNQLKDCNWMEDEPLYLPDDDDYFEQMLITWLNEFNVTYSLSNGALLGAYRHHGKIPDDYDVDLDFPIWLNFDLDPGNHKNGLKGYLSLLVPRYSSTMPQRGPWLSNVCLPSNKGGVDDALCFQGPSGWVKELLHR